MNRSASCRLRRSGWRRNHEGPLVKRVGFFQRDLVMTRRERLARNYHHRADARAWSTTGLSTPALRSTAVQERWQSNRRGRVSAADRAQVAPALWLPAD